MNLRVNIKFYIFVFMLIFFVKCATVEKADTSTLLGKSKVIDQIAKNSDHSEKNSSDNNVQLEQQLNEKIERSPRDKTVNLKDVSHDLKSNLSFKFFLTNNEISIKEDFDSVKYNNASLYDYENIFKDSSNSKDIFDRSKLKRYVSNVNTVPTRKEDIKIDNNPFVENNLQTDKVVAVHTKSQKQFVEGAPETPGETPPEVPPGETPPETPPGEKPPDTNDPSVTKKPDEKPTEAPKTEPGITTTTPSSKPVDKPPDKDKPDKKPDDKPTEAPNKPVEPGHKNSSDTPTSKPGDKPPDVTTSKPSDVPKDKPGENPEHQPGSKPNDTSSEKPVSTTTLKPEEKPVPPLTEKPGTPTDKPVDKPPGDAKNKTDEKPETNPVDKTTIATTNLPGNNPVTQPTNKPVDPSHNKTEDKPIHHPEKSPDDKTPDKPGEVPKNVTDNKPISTTTHTPVNKPDIPTKPADTTPIPPVTTQKTKPPVAPPPEEPKGVVPPKDSTSKPINPEPPQETHTTQPHQPTTVKPAVNPPVESHTVKPAEITTPHTVTRPHQKTTTTSHAPHTSTANTEPSKDETTTVAAPTEVPDVDFFAWRWDLLSTHFTFTMMMLVILILKVVFRSIRVISSRIPEHCLMIGFGAILVVTLRYYRFKLIQDPDLLIASNVTTNATSQAQQVSTVLPPTGNNTNGTNDLGPIINVFSLPPFTSNLYFMALAPPVLLESAYSLHDSALSSNIYPILMLAIIGKVSSMFTTAYVLFVASQNDYMGGPLKVYGDSNITRYHNLTVTDSLIFSSVLTGVDASPVFHILQNAAVNKDLFYILLGESLLNDAVTNTLYSTVLRLTSKEGDSNMNTYLLIVGSFFYVSFGGVLFGIVAGFATSFMTRFTASYRMVEPLLLVCCAYFAYILARIYEISGQTCLIACGLIQAHYAFKNISGTSCITVRYIINIISSTSDCFKFVFLGLATYADITVWHTGFFLWSLLFPFVLRFIVVFLLIGLYNLLSYRYIPFRDQIIIGYCGLRGAVCYCLIYMLNRQYVPRELFTTTMIIIIIWTGLVQGGSIKYLVEVLDIDIDKLKTMNEEVHENILSVITTGVESIGTVHEEDFISRSLGWLDKNVLMKIFVNKSLREDNGMRELSDKLMINRSRKPVWMARGVPNVTINEEIPPAPANTPSPPTPHPPQQQFNKMAPFSMQDQPWLPGIPPGQEPRMVPFSIRDEPWLPGIPRNQHPRQAPFSVVEQPWLPGIPINGPRRRRRQAVPHDLGETLREAMRNTPFQRMQYRNDRRTIQDNFQQAPPMELSGTLPNINLRTGQALLAMHEVPGRRQPNAARVNEEDLRRRLFVAQLAMPLRRRSQQTNPQQETPAAAVDASPQRRPPKKQ